MSANFFQTLENRPGLSYHVEHMGAWLSWLERLVDVEKVRGSSPLVPTKGDGDYTVAFLFPPYRQCTPLHYCTSRYASWVIFINPIATKPA